MTKIRFNLKNHQALAHALGLCFWWRIGVGSGYQEERGAGSLDLLTTAVVHKRPQWSVSLDISLVHASKRKCPCLWERGDGFMIAEFTTASHQHVTTTQSDTSATAEADVLWRPVALLLEEDDEFFSDKLPDCIKTAERGPHAGLFWHPQVQARLCRLRDPDFTGAVLELAHPDCLGLDLLFDERLLPRLAAMRNSHLRGTFLPYARRIPGFDARDFLRELRPYLLRHSAQQGCHQVFAPMTGAALLAKDIPDLAFIVEDILPVGATLFVGRAKDGKSLAMWNLCLAVATGGVVFGRYPTTPGPVLYLALEDGERRAKKRLQDQLGAMHMDTCPEGFELVCWDAPRVGEGLEEKLHDWLDTHPGAKLIVIDILEKVRPPRTRNGSVYADDYAAVAPLQRLAQDRGIAIVIVHHTHKAKAEDFRDTPSGSMSLLGAVDTLWSLRRVAGETDAVLQITGRDLIEMPDLAMEFKDGFWTARGDATTTILNPAHQAIVDTLRTTGYPMTPTQLAIVLDVNLNTVKVHLMRLVERGLVAKAGEGRYAHRVRTPESPEGVTHCNPETQAPPPPPCPPVAPDPREEDAPSRQDIPMMSLPSSVDETSEEIVEETPEAPVAIQVTQVTPTVPPAPNGQGQPSTNGHTPNGTPHDSTPVEEPPQFCPGCSDPTCWLDRETYFQCAKRSCGRKVVKRTGTNGRSPRE
jgi:AAA domain